MRCNVLNDSIELGEVMMKGISDDINSRSLLFHAIDIFYRMKAH